MKVVIPVRDLKLALKRMERGSIGDFKGYV